MNRNKSRKNNGITLIALIITIIVMLILVAVTINMAINGGLFEKAGQAVGATRNAINQEQQMINDIMEEYFGNSSGGETGNTLPTYSNAAQTNGFLTEKATYSDEVETNPAVIPAGYKIVNYGEKIANGIVIADSNNNEFVWIPVEKAIVTESEIAQIKADDITITTDLKAVQKMVNNGTYPMAVQVGTNYKGILYDFSGIDTLTLTVKDWNSASSYREPEVLFYDTQTNFDKYELGEYSDTLYQNAYNQMVQRVAQNGGFYVGRYEISTGTYKDAKGNTITYAQSQKDQTALTDITWYEMYKYERDYAKYNTSLGVTSEMIWGSQWDQMMIFVNGKNDGKTTPAKFYVAKTGPRISGISTTKTGKNTVDQVANIFDLEASRYEWTQEAGSSNDRVIRGGNYISSYCASDRNHYRLAPAYTGIDFSSRVALYIK